MAYERNIGCFGCLLVPSLHWTWTSYTSIMNWAQAHEPKNASSPSVGRTCVSGCDFPLKLHPCAHAGALAVMSPCMTSCVHMCLHVCVYTCARPGSCIHLYNACILMESCPDVSSKAAATVKSLGKTGKRNLPAGFIRLVLWMSQAVSEK